MRCLPLLLLLAACTGTDDGSKDGSADDTGSPDTDTGKDDTGKGKDTSDSDTDTDTDTDTDRPDSGDTSEPPPPIQTGYTGPTLVALIVNGATGSGVTDPSSVKLYDPAGGTTTTVSGLTVRGDALVDCAGDSIFVLESRGADGQNDRVVRIDPDAATYTEWSLGSNFQPRDVASVLDGFWIANWGKSRISTYDKDGVQGPFVTLDAYADADGLPEVNGIYAVGTTVFVTVVRQTQSTGALNGAKLLEVDADTNTVTRSVDLAGDWPSGRMLAGADKIHVHVRSTANVDGSLNADGGLESVSTVDFTTSGLVVDDSTTGDKQTVAYLDPFSMTAWFARVSSSGAPSMSAVSLLDATALQSWPTAGLATGAGLAEGSVWVAENPFDGSDGALVARSPADGAETVRETQDGVVKAMATCVNGSFTGGGDGGGQGQASP